MKRRRYDQLSHGCIYLIGDKKMIDALNEKEEGLAQKLIDGGAAFEADTLEEAAQMAGLDPAVVADTVAKYNGYVDAGEDPDFGRTEFNGKAEEGPFYIAVSEAIYHLTFGGLVINTNAEVLDADNNVIPGLYAAGDVISGFEGAAHQSGDCLTEVLYYGRVAGQQAAARQ